MEVREPVSRYVCCKSDSSVFGVRAMDGYIDSDNNVTRWKKAVEQSSLNI